MTNAYLVDRLRCDARHVKDLAQCASTIPHQGLKGRFREILVDNFLAPWLPPDVACGTGMIVDNYDQKRQFTQEDVVIYDKSLTPPILAGRTSSEGLFLCNSVLARIEVKSELTNKSVVQFVKPSNELASLKFTTYPSTRRDLEAPFSVLFAYDTNLGSSEGDPNKELHRLIRTMKRLGVDPLGGIVSYFCIVGKGLWKINKDGNGRYWARLRTGEELDEVIYFLAILSSTCFQEHAKRQGRNPCIGLEAGIGHYFDSPYEKVDISKSG